MREIAEECLNPADLKEGLIHSLQKYVEVDEPEPEAVPMIGSSTDDDIVFDRMSEEDLLRGLENMAPPEPVATTEET